MPESKLNMNLSHEDANLFFKLMWALQFYVNRRLDLLPGITSAEQYARLDSEEKLEAREALWKDLTLVDDFVAENPASLSSDALEIVHSWKRRIAGVFYISRFLKRYTVFLAAEKKAGVYGVLGLYDSLEDVVPDWPLPIMVEAVLLPFKGRIIYDGLLISRSIMFGPGIRADLNEIYQRAKQQGAIVESLEPDSVIHPPPKIMKPKHNWRPVLDSLVETTESLHQAETVVQTQTFKVLKVSARLAQAATHDPGNLDEINRLARRTQAALRQLETALNRAQWE